MGDKPNQDEEFREQTNKNINMVSVFDLRPLHKRY